MLGQGWSLAAGPDNVASELGGGLYSAAVLGVVPLLIAIALTRSPRRQDAATARR